MGEGATCYTTLHTKILPEFSLFCQIVRTELKVPKYNDSFCFLIP